MGNPIVETIHAPLGKRAGRLSGLGPQTGRPVPAHSPPATTAGERF